MSIPSTVPANASGPVPMSPPTKQDGPYTAVVYVHGMGSQKRYEEVSHLVDALDDYAQGRNPTEAQIPDRTKRLIQSDYLTQILPYLENTEAPSEYTSYIRVSHKLHNKGLSDLEPFRFHEVYWAPVTASGVPPREVFLWLLGQVSKPWAILRTPWRDRQRYRRSVLHRLRTELKGSQNDPFQGDDLQLLVKAYHNFERPDARRRPGKNKKPNKGHFQDFVNYLEDINEGFPTYLGHATPPTSTQTKQQARLVKLAHRWCWRCVKAELINQFLLLTIATAMVVGIAAMARLAYLILYGLSKGWGHQLVAFLKEVPAFDKLVQATDANVVGLMTLAASVFPIYSFLSKYMGDVQFWSTYEETDEKHKKREEIVKRTTTTLKHVLTDKKCKRVVIVAHSLGAAVAYDSLLELGKLNQIQVTEWTDAKQLANLPKVPLQLYKIDTLITMGCPVDKIHYLFESHKGPNHRYIRVVDQVRGDLGKVPFATHARFRPDDPKSGHGDKLIRWVNFWDEADIISGPQFTPANWWNADLTVDNYHSRSYLFPNPSKCHGGYFQNAEVIKHVYETVFNSHVPRDERVNAAPMGPGNFWRLTRFLQGTAVFLLWIIVAHIIVWMMHITLLMNIAICLELICIGVLAVAYFVDRSHGPLKPLS